MSLGTELKAFAIKGEALAALFEPKVISGAKEALVITGKILSLLSTPEALVIESLIPNGASYAVAATAIINDALPAIKLIAGIGDTSSTKGLLQRLGAELFGLIHGGNKGRSFYISAFDYICFGAGANPIV